MSDEHYDAIQKIMSMQLDTIESQRETIDRYQNLITENNQAFKAMARNNDILMELVNEMTEALLELRKITWKYHPMIIRGEASMDDVKECSRIVQRAQKYLARASNLQELYSKIFKDPYQLTETIDITKER